MVRVLRSGYGIVVLIWLLSVFLFLKDLQR